MLGGNDVNNTRVRNVAVLKTEEENAGLGKARNSAVREVE